ncbi:MAG: lysophospholipid acyltransferase family protein [Leptonema sp. (in: bacteria)]
MVQELDIKKILKQKGRKSNLLISLYYWIGIILLTILYGIRVTPYIFLKKQEEVHRIAILWGKAIVKFSKIQIQLYDVEKVYKRGPVIFICNHQSLFDVFIFYSFLDVSFRWMAKQSLFKLPIIGPSMKAAGYIPVEREDKKKAMQSLFDAAEQIQSGKSVIIFPEGTRGKIDGEMLPFKKGSFILAKKANVVIQPIAIWGSQYIIPVERDKFFQRIYPGKVWAKVGEPISPEDYKNLSVEELSNYLRKILEENISFLKKEELKTLKKDFS